ncbi:MAG: hypothetical protein U0414_09155 [Polyangiaceae bacterium]
MTETEEASADDEETPTVVLARLGDLGRFVPEAMLKVYKTRPVWFLLGMDQELVELFDRVPEDPMQKGHVTAILGALRAFAQHHNGPLQAILGVTDELAYGFHTDATYDRVLESFEEDGFDVLEEVIEGGEIR